MTPPDLEVVKLENGCTGLREAAQAWADTHDAGEARRASITDEMPEEERRAILSATLIAEVKSEERLRAALATVSALEIWPHDQAPLP